MTVGFMGAICMQGFITLCFHELYAPMAIGCRHVLFMKFVVWVIKSVLFFVNKKES